MPDDQSAVPGQFGTVSDRASHGHDPSKEESSAKTEVARPASDASAPLDRGLEMGPDVGTADPTDGRVRYDWKSHYPDAARAQIRREACYIVLLLFASLILILATWKGVLADLLSVTGDSAATLKKYSTYSSSGLLGGAVFGIKHLYRYVARGYWHEDRKLWRYHSPLVALALAFVMGAAVEASVVSPRGLTSTGAIVTFGFLVGYFADHAIGKLQEIATVMFGTSMKSREKSKNTSGGE